MCVYLAAFFYVCVISPIFLSQNSYTSSYIMFVIQTYTYTSTPPYTAVFLKNPVNYLKTHNCNIYTWPYVIFDGLQNSYQIKWDKKFTSPSFYYFCQSTFFLNMEWHIEI